MQTKDQKPFKSALVGGFVGAIEISVTYPFEYLKTVLQIEGHNDLKRTAQRTYREHGVRGFFRGYSVLLLFAVPKSSLRFGNYYLARSYLFTSDTFGASFMSGIFTGLVEGCTMMPIQETLKTKLIHDRLSPNPKYGSLVDGATKIFRQ